MSYETTFPKWDSEVAEAKAHAISDALGDVIPTQELLDMLDSAFESGMTFGYLDA